MLVDGGGLAGKLGFDGAQLLAKDDAQIGRHLVAGGEPDHIAGYQMHRIHAPPVASPQHGDLGRQGARQCRQRGLGLAFLQVADHRVDYHHAENYRAVDPFPQAGSDDAGTDQHQHQWFRQLAQEARQRAAPGRFAQAVGTMVQESLRGFVFRKTLLRVDTVVGQSVGHGQGMPWRIGGLCRRRLWCGHGPIMQ